MKRYYRLLLTLIGFLVLGYASLHVLLPAVLLPSGLDDSNNSERRPIEAIMGSIGGGTRWKWWKETSGAGPIIDLPPLYETYLDYEAALPQNHNTEQKKRRYIHFANHVHLLGFNNHLQELNLNAHLAYLVNRSFVFYDYVWNPAWEEGTRWSVWPEGSGEVEVVEENIREDGTVMRKGRVVGGRGDVKGRVIPSRIPLSALLGGWIAGGARMSITGMVDRVGILGNTDDYPDDDLTPISRPHFEAICQKEVRFYIKADEVNDTPLSEYLDSADSGKRVRDGTSAQIVQAWIARLNRDDVKDQRCVEIAKSSGQVFDFWVFGTPSLHSIWPSLQWSPVLQYWSWSPLVYGAFIRNVLGLGIEWPSRAGPTTPIGDGTGILGGTVKAIVASEIRRGVEGNRNQTGYPAYPSDYPYPPFIEDRKELELYKGAGELSDILTGQQIKVFPYSKTPSTVDLPSLKHGEGSDALSPMSSMIHSRPNPSVPAMLPILALHLRRGDFVDHCVQLVKYSAGFMGYCSLGAGRVPFVDGKRRGRRDGAYGADSFVVPHVVEDGGIGDSRESVNRKWEVEHGHEDRSEERTARIAISLKKELKVASKIEFGLLDEGDASELNSTKLGQSDDKLIVSSEKEKKSIYKSRCFPTMEEIGRRVREVVADWAAWRFAEFVDEYERLAIERADFDDDAKNDLGRFQQRLTDFRTSLESSLTSVYLMTNGDEAWAGEMKEEVAEVLAGMEVRVRAEVEVVGEDLKRRTVVRNLEWSNPSWSRSIIVGDPLGNNEEGEEEDDEDPSHMLMNDDSKSTTRLTIASSRNLVLKPEEKYVGQAIDIYIAQRAQVFIGNGFSSMTGNVVMLRMKDGLEGVQTRFW